MQMEVNLIQSCLPVRYCDFSETSIYNKSSKLKHLQTLRHCVITWFNFTSKDH